MRLTYRTVRVLAVIIVPRQRRAIAEGSGVANKAKSRSC